MSVCPRCAAAFTCAMAEQTGKPCWCASLPFEPALPIYPEQSDLQHSCVCPVCMQQWRAAKEHPDNNTGN